ncbi:hypothetical protein N7532_001190 [Penicillium argentinense]|uniref:Cyanovirin-N domain-containing protein n=1 Tax=Penicillium argentinense TaxID=1131581 RepID=A0A9W9KLH1_9EURO|nr:uncharacterized protein N7532_001190 [Penicillium argentinense]KAJ5110655.1 hypothetical protein N7532_001190 [Penicillium argentinense]
MHFFMTCIALLPLFTMAVSGASKFANTCQNIESNGNAIRADCRENENGQYRTSTLDLNRCIKNKKGGLKCGKNGDYTASCINCTLRGHTDFECMCRNVDEGHRYVRAHIDLNKCISNNHGELGC